MLTNMRRTLALGGVICGLLARTSIVAPAGAANVQRYMDLQRECVLMFLARDGVPE